MQLARVVSRGAAAAAAMCVAGAVWGAGRMPAGARSVHRAPARYLFAWAGDDDRKESDFLAVIDLARHGDRYGTIVATLPVGDTGVWPHHTEHELGPSGMLFANGFAGDRSYLFDLRDPMHPKVAARFADAGGLSFLHSFVRLPNGHVLATFQGHGPDDASPGGIAELDDVGRLVRSRSAADSSADSTILRPYSLAVVPSLDRVVVGLTPMPIPSWHRLHAVAGEPRGSRVQVYRLSDLALIKTIALPSNDGPNEPRALRDGRTVLVNTVQCRLYRVTGLEGTAPGLALVHEEPAAGCATPVVVGDYWVQADAPNHRVFSLDVRDPARVRLVSEVSFDARQRPHWVATDGARIVVVNDPSPASERRMWMLDIDPATGVLVLDRDFRDAGSTRPGVAFDRLDWPHGETGPAVPHGTVFGW